MLTRLRCAQTLLVLHPVRVRYAASVSRLSTHSGSSQSSSGVHLWPLRDPVAAAASPAPLSTAALLRRFVDLLRPTHPSLTSHRAPYRGAVLLLQPHDELTAASRDLASLLRMPLYAQTEDTLDEAEQATLLQPAPDVTASPPHLSAQDAATSPLFLLLVSEHRVSAVQLDRKPVDKKSARRMRRFRGTSEPVDEEDEGGEEEEMRLVPGGQVCVQLSTYKRAGSHGFDATSPLLRACVVDVHPRKRPPISAASPIAPSTSTSSSAPAASPRTVSATSPPPVHVLDATMGLGVDSVLLASFGARVTMVEREPLLALLMMDALRRAHKHFAVDADANWATGNNSKQKQAAAQEAAEEMRRILGRITLHCGSAQEYLRSLAASSAAVVPVATISSSDSQSSSQSPLPDVVYLDPFYPDAPPSELPSAVAGRPRKDASASKSKKHMELARMLWEHTQTPTIDTTSSEVDMSTSADAADPPAPSPASSPFYASPANLALHSLLSSALSLPASPRVVLKHPVAPFARRLLRDMNFAVEHSYEARDTVYHVMRRRGAPAPGQGGDTTSARVPSSVPATEAVAPSSSSSSPTLPHPTSRKQASKQAPRSQKKHQQKKPSRGKR